MDAIIDPANGFLEIDKITNIAPFELKSANGGAPILIACPHSGRHYPDDFLASSRLEKDTLRLNEDAFTDLLCQDLPINGYSLICANYARSYIDLNRDPEILDPKIISGAKPTNCPMTYSGFGVIARHVGIGHVIYDKTLPLEDAQKRIADIHTPYHEAITKFIGNLKRNFGHAIFIDIHSMPNISLGNLKADIVIGDRFGKSCSPELTEIIAAHFSNLGLTVRRNHPFAGGYSTIEYGNPKDNIDAVQIEFNRALYMNETQFKLNDGFGEIKNAINSLIQTIDAQYAQTRKAPQ